MKYLQEYKIFESKFFTTKEKTQKWIDSLCIKNSIVNGDLTVNVKGNVDINGYNLYHIPVQFGKVDGDFYCCNNELKSLKGCPKYVGGDFEFFNNQLYDLRYFPENVLERDINHDENNYQINRRTLNFLSMSHFTQNPIYDFMLLMTYNYIFGSKIPIFIKYLNEYDVIQGNLIYLDRLKEALYMIDFDNNFDFKRLNSLKKYKIID